MLKSTSAPRIAATWPANPVGELNWRKQIHCSLHAKTRLMRQAPRARVGPVFQGHVSGHGREMLQPPQEPEVAAVCHLSNKTHFVVMGASNCGISPAPQLRNHSYLMDKEKVTIRAACIE